MPPVAGARKKTSRLTAALAWFFISTCQALPDYGIAQLQPRPSSGIQWYAGPGWLHLTAFPGVSTTDNTPLPLIEAYGSNGCFFSTNEGMGCDLSQNSHWQYGPRLTPLFPRSPKETASPVQADDIGYRIEKGAFLNYNPWDFLQFASGLRYGSGKHSDGLLGDIALLTGYDVNDHLELGVQMGARFGNCAYVDSYYALNSSGYFLLQKSVDWLAYVKLDSRWDLQFDIGHTVLSPTLRTSPLFRAQTPIDWFVATEYRF